MRLLLLTVISREGLSDKERQRFLDAAQFSTDEIQALTNLSVLQVRLSTNMERKSNEQRVFPLI